MSDLRDDLKAYLDGELPPEKAQEVHDALSQDPAMAAEAREFEAISSILRNEVRDPRPYGLETTLMALSGRDREAEIPAAPPWVWIFRGAVALGIGAAVVIGAVNLNPPTPKTAFDTRTTAIRDLTQRLDLPPKSNASMPDRTEMLYAPDAIALPPQASSTAAKAPVPLAGAPGAIPPTVAGPGGGGGGMGGFAGGGFGNSAPIPPSTLSGHLPGGPGVSGPIVGGPLPPVPGTGSPLAPFRPDVTPAKVDPALVKASEAAVRHVVKVAGAQVVGSSALRGVEGNAGRSILVAVDARHAAALVESLRTVIGQMGTVSDPFDSPTAMDQNPQTVDGVVDASPRTMTKARATAPSFEKYDGNLPRVAPGVRNQQQMRGQFAGSMGGGSNDFVSTGRTPNGAPAPVGAAGATFGGGRGGAATGGSNAVNLDQPLTPQAIEDQLAKLRKKRTDLLIDFYPDAVPVKEVDADIADLEKQLAATKLSQAKSKPSPTRNASGRKLIQIMIRPHLPGLNP